MLFVFWFLCAILGAATLGRYNKAGIGFLLGLFLGPFGLLFALVIRNGENKNVEKQRHEEQLKAIKDSAANTGQPDPSAYRECPYCAESILAKAKVCKHCHKEVDPIITP